MNNNEQFICNGNAFEIRTTIIDDKYCVKVFLNNEVVSPNYSVDFETHGDYFSQHQESLVNSLIGIAKSDIEQGIYFKKA